MWELLNFWGFKWKSKMMMRTVPQQMGSLPFKICNKTFYLSLDSVRFKNALRHHSPPKRKDIST